MSCVVNRFLFALLACLIIIGLAHTSVSAQRKSKKKPEPEPATDLAKLREEVIRLTNETKAGYAKLVVIYEADVTKAEEQLAVYKKLQEDGLVARVQVEEKEKAVADARAKVAATKKQMTDADSQIASMLAETEVEKTIAKNLRLARQSLVRTTAFIRYAGSSGWSLGEAWKVQRFFSDTFHKELPIAVFGQGAIHDRWRLDHRNSMDISLHPDSAEGQALLAFLQKNGIPYLAFRAAIPGTATGPHIHIGRPSHRY